MTHPITAQELSAVKLSRVRWREGYDIAQVDTFLAAAVAALGAGAPGAGGAAMRPQDVVDERFRTTMLRTGYSQDEVDDLLDRVAAGLEKRVS
jgi:DivIVA domain-containing protein